MNKPEIVLILEDIRSVYNVGSIFRTADGFGVSKIYLNGFTPEPIDRFGRERPDFHKTALGAEKSVAWEKLEIEKIFKKLHTEGFKIFAIEQGEGAKDLRQLKPDGKIALVFGSETEGVKKATLENSDEVFEIKMVGKKESFNVATTVAIALYQANL